MSTEHDVEHHHHHHRNRQMAKRLESVIGVLMVIAIAVLAIGLIYGIVQTGSSPPEYMR